MPRCYNPVLSMLAPPVLAAGLLLVGCASVAPSADPTSAGGAAASDSAAAPAAVPSAGSPAPAAPPEPGAEEQVDLSQPPDGKWLVDAEGREYFLHELPKHEGHYVVIEPGRVKIDYGTSFDFVEERPTSFMVKIYNPRPEGYERRSVTRTPTPLDLNRVTASYQPKVGTADRLQLQAWGRGLPTEGQWRQGFELVDFDGDGDLDIVHSPPRKGSFAAQVFLNEGGGSWRRSELQSTRQFGLDYGDLAVADFNGDGHLDLAFAVHLRGFKVLVADGRGGYSDWSEGLEYAGPGDQTPHFTSRTLVATDWNGDGRPDLLALGEGPRLAIGRRDGPGGFDRGGHGPVLFLNQGDGRWVAHDEGTGRERVYGEVIALADLDGDGATDFVTGSRIAKNARILHYRAGDSWRVAALPTARPGVVTAVVVRDFDGDGRPDLALGYTSTELGGQWSGIDVQYQYVPGEWRRVPVFSRQDNVGVTALAAGDLDGDGALDLVGITEEGDRLLFLGDGRGGFLAEESPELPPKTGCAGYGLALADLDGDGRDEIVVGYAGESGMEVVLGGPPSCPRDGAIEVWKAVPAGR